MLEPMKRIYENPEDVPVLSEVQTQGIQARFNAGFLIESGEVSNLKKQGWSEEFILGYLAAMSKVCRTLDDWHILINEDKEA